MTSADLLVDAYTRIHDSVHRAADGLSPEQLEFRVDEDANSIAWLIWHLTRVQDDHVADVAGTEQVWTSGGWAERFGLPFSIEATGYAHNSDEVAALGSISAELLAGYHRATVEATRRFVSTLSDSDLERVVDTSWNPPVTLGVRLVSVISDGLQHAGQAAYSRGIHSRVG
jgi:uncharacterized damage-inducible protein DinB